jgi:predicted aspartyl protease
MPIRDRPFIKISRHAIARPALPIIISNPHTGKIVSTYGLIDTGADECAIPAKLADVLGHNIKKGLKKLITTSSGLTKAYIHTTDFTIIHPETGNVVYKIEETPVDYLTGLPIVLLGVRNFLGDFILNIDYTKEVFSLVLPSK